jgi:hypothetical protein
MGRQNRMDRAPGEFAVADFAPSRAAHAAGLIHRKRWEVVVQKEGFLVGPLQGVNELLVFAGAEGSDHEGLSLTAGKQCRAVGAR